MIKIWVNRLIAGTQNWLDVPSKRRPEVLKELDQRVSNGEITKEERNKIVLIGE